MLSKKELEELRPWVSESVTAFLGFSEDTVVNAALDCVAKSLSRQATTGKRILFYLARTAPASILNASPSWASLSKKRIVLAYVMTHKPCIAAGFVTAAS